MILKQERILHCLHSIGFYSQLSHYSRSCGVITPRTSLRVLFTPHLSEIAVCYTTGIDLWRVVLSSQIKRSSQNAGGLH
ncbi:hypothetical protein ACET3Z_004731 [Daucus carota]